MLSNNDILKKLRVALSLRNDDIIEILKLIDVIIIRNPEHLKISKNPLFTSKEFLATN
jgi:uncharacterized protein YehS (DUF1456 family)